MSGRSRIPVDGLTLQYPLSLGTFDKYEDAQKAVDYLSDHEFAVENCMIVGTDLKQVERVTGRLTTGRVALGGPDRPVVTSCAHSPITAGACSPRADDAR